MRLKTANARKGIKTLLIVETHDSLFRRWSEDSQCSEGH